MSKSKLGTFSLKNRSLKKKPKKQEKFFKRVLGHIAATCRLASCLVSLVGKGKIGDELTKFVLSALLELWKAMVAVWLNCCNLTPFRRANEALCSQPVS